MVERKEMLGEEYEKGLKEILVEELEERNKVE